MVENVKVQFLINSAKNKIICNFPNTLKLQVMNRTSLVQLVIVLIVVMFAAVPKVEAQEMSLMDYYKWGSIDSSLQKYGQKYRYLYDEMARRFTEIKTIDYINLITDKRLWPKALQSETRDPKILNKYKSYWVTNKYVYYGNYIFGHHYLVFIPKDLNTKMPLDYRPENDFVIFQEAPSSGFNYKKRIDFSQYLPEPPVCNQFSYLYKWIEKFQNPFVNIRSEGILLKNGNRIYPCNELIPGFQNISEGITKYGEQYMVSTFDAGVFTDEALNTFDQMLKALYSDGENFYKFQLNQLDRTNADLISTNKDLAPFTINLSLDSKKDSIEHFQINLAIFKTVDDSVFKEWMQLGEAALKHIQDEGFERVTTRTGTSDWNIRESINLSDDKLLGWHLFVSDSSARATLVNEANGFRFDLGRPLKIGNVWRFSGIDILAPVNHRMEIEMTPGRWAMYMGLKKSDKPNESWVKYLKDKENARLLEEENKKKTDELWEKVKSDVTKQMKDSGFYDIQVKWVDGNYLETFEGASAEYYWDKVVQCVVCTQFEKLYLELWDKDVNSLYPTNINDRGMIMQAISWVPSEYNRFKKFTLRLTGKMFYTVPEEQKKMSAMVFIGTRKKRSYLEGN
jgi:hypothetical protein